MRGGEIEFMKNNFIDNLIKYRSENFDEIYDFLSLKNGQQAIMFFPKVVDDSIIITIFIEEDYCRLLASFNKIDKEVSLGDISDTQDKLKNIGVGTILIEKLLEIAGNERAEKITGWMKYESEEQRKRQIAFYKKNGFTIDEKENLLYRF